MRSKPSGKLFDHPSDMEPLLPEDGDGGLAGTALVLTVGPTTQFGRQARVERARI